MMCNIVVNIRGSVSGKKFVIKYAVRQLVMIMKITRHTIICFSFIIHNEFARGNKNSILADTCGQRQVSISMVTNYALKTS